MLKEHERFNYPKTDKKIFKIMPSISIGQIKIQW